MILTIKINVPYWLREQELNLQSLGYEPNILPLHYPAIFYMAQGISAIITLPHIYWSYATLFEIGIFTVVCQHYQPLRKPQIALLFTGFISTLGSTNWQGP